jgi:EpsI family protein
MKLPYRSNFSWHVLVAFLLLSTTLVASKLTELRKPERLAQPLDTIDRNIASFTGSDSPPLSDGVLQKLLADSYLARNYRKPGANVDLFIAFYAQQRAGENMHSPKHCLPGAGWEIAEYGTTDIPVNSQLFKINQYKITKERERVLVLYWYQSKNRIIASEYMGKILLARDALLHNSTAGSIVRITAADQPGALDSLRNFAAGVIPQMQRCFGD